MCSEKDYYARPEWSYSQMKNILAHDINWAVAAKRKMFNGALEPASKAIDLGQLAHMFVLGGDAGQFVVPPYPDFRTKEARDWKAQQIADGNIIVAKDQYEAISSIVDNIEAHHMSKRLLIGDKVKHETELYATVAGIPLRGKADAILVDGDALIITDIKTTAQFDDWKWKAKRQHYDLQAELYSIIGAAAMKIAPQNANFYFCVVETVAPFRVQYHHASTEFLESGADKLNRCLNEIKQFGDKEPNFLIEDVNELGDYSL